MNKLLKLSVAIPALAIVLLVFSFLLLGAINLLEQWSSRFQH